MARYLRANTATIVTVGPFYDKTDGVTIENSLTITNERITMTVDNNDGSAPTIVLDNVTGATSGTDNDLNYITNCDAGLMQIELSAANTNHAGKRAMLTITDAANHVPVFHEFQILVANVYDALIGTDYLQTHAVEITNDLITAAAIADGAIDAGALAGDCITAAKIADNAIAAEHLAANAIDFATFAADCKTGTGLKANVESISAGAITATAIAADAITEAKIADNAIAAEHLAANAIDFATFAADCKTGSGLKANVESISANAITATAIAADAITAAKIANGAIDNATFAADVGSTAYATNIIAIAAKKAIDEYDPPTNAEFELRSLAAADYTVVSDLGTVQTGDAFARLGAPAGASVSADIAAVKAQTGAIETDTQDLQTQVGVDGAGLTAVPWNAAWDAEVQSEVDDALTTDTGPLSIAWGTLIERIYQMINNRMAVTEATGAVALRNIGNTGDIATGNVASSSGTTTRAELSWA